MKTESKMPPQVDEKCDQQFTFLSLLYVRRRGRLKGRGRGRASRSIRNYGILLNDKEKSRRENQNPSTSKKTKKGPYHRRPLTTHNKKQGHKDKRKGEKQGVTSLTRKNLIMGSRGRRTDLAVSTQRRNKNEVDTRFVPPFPKAVSSLACHCSKGNDRINRRKSARLIDSSLQEIRDEDSDGDTYSSNNESMTSISTKEHRESFTRAWLRKSFRRPVNNLATTSTVVQH